MCKDPFSNMQDEKMTRLNSVGTTKMFNQNIDLNLADLGLNEQNSVHR